jgi:cytochrome c556
MKRFAFLFAFAAMLASPFASAQMKAEDQVKFRKAAFNVIAFNFGNLGAMANERKPFNAAEAAKNAQVIADVADMPWGLFGPGTESGTKAKPEIWRELEKFRGMSNDMQTAAKNLQAGGTKDLASLKAAFGEMGKSCKACHDAYRAQ